LNERLSQALASLSPAELDLYSNLPEEPPSATGDWDGAFKLHALLKALDPDVAARWHWKDSRKVIRSLEIIRETGRLVSETIAEQSQETLPPRRVSKQAHSTSIDTIYPRYRALCFWLYSDPVALNSRLDARVDQMVKVQTRSKNCCIYP
jgi:tRNA dimethylallyltransferase